MTTIVVTAAVIERDGRFLVTRRQAGVHLEGYWEFPGGKCDPGETLDRVPRARAARRAGRRRAHRRRDVHDDARLSGSARRAALLRAASCSASRGRSSVRRCAGCARGELAALEFPPADAELIRVLQAALKGRLKADA